MATPEVQSTSPPRKRRWYQFSLRTLLVGTAIVAFLLGLAIHLRIHLYVWYATASGRLAEAIPVATTVMSDLSQPEDWVDCEFGSLHFKLPTRMAESVETHGSNAQYRVFRDGSKCIIMARPEGIDDEEEFFLQTLKLPPQGRGMSRPRLRSAWSQASPADFRWTMSQDEVRWHAWCIAMNGIFRLEPDGWAETMFGADLDGILFIRQDCQHASFDWQSNSKRINGFIHFKDTSAAPDPDWMRCVCKSVRVFEE